MKWSDVLIIVLAIIDCAALFVGLTILRRVTRIVVETGDAIHSAVSDSIGEAKTEAVHEFTAAVGPALGLLAAEIPKALREGIKGVRVSAGGTLTFQDGEAATHLEVVDDERTA